MKNFLTSFFFWFKKGPTFALGALPSPEDKRNLNLAAIQAAVTLPDDFENPLPYVRDQMTTPKCTACAIATIMEMYLAKKQITYKLSDDDLYNQCKAVDGIPNVQGTYPSVAASVAFKTGVASEIAYATKDASIIAADRAKYKVGGYAFVSADFPSITQAIFQNGAITASVLVDGNWFIGIITKVLQAIGRHYVVWNGATISKQILKGQNSWGINWIGQIAGMLNPSVKPGHFQMAWADVQGTVIDIIAFTDIPAPILQTVTDKPYYFNRTLQRGDNGQDVLELQKRLAQEACWDMTAAMAPIYGPATARAVLQYQYKKKIITSAADSNSGNSCGPKTIRSLNGEVGLDFDTAVIQQESNGNDYVIGDKNLTNKAYGCLQIRFGVCADVNARFGLALKPENMLGNRALSLDTFHKYISIYEPDGTNEAKARLWNGGPNWRNYPSTETYWNEVQAKMQ